MYRIILGGDLIFKKARCEMKPYNALDIARYVINYSSDKGYSMSNLKLQKVLYFIQVWFLIKKSKQCFKEEIQAWDFGPVVPIVYREFKSYGSSNLPKIKTFIGYDDDFWKSKIIEYNDDFLSERDKQAINHIVDALAKFSTTYLVELTHKQTPWKDAYAQGKNTPITIESIRGYFNG